MATVVVDPLLTPDEVASILGVEVQTLYKWRTLKPAYGPAAIKVGKYLRWKSSTVQAWIDAQGPASNVTPIKRTA
ncbi:helix-turn-helix transcriptional regulator [Microbacterium sp. 22195]|uniref:helix-turn-helix transcriptional regulator n=1 Tax=Microbacterium sp. 22195 TaxID=3453891 RepID=UPI003F860222